MKAPYTAATLVVVMLVFVGSTTAVRFDETSAYQTCIAAPASCTMLGTGHSSLTGTLPSELGTLTNLTSLWLDGNQLTGTLPTELGALTLLGGMELFYNQLTGTIPSEIGALTSLQMLELGYNRLTGTLPSEMGALTRLGIMDLQDNRLTGSLPSELGALTSVAGYIICNNTGLCGDVPPELDLHSWTGSCATEGIPLLGSDCPTSSPTEAVSGEQPLKDNWFRKRDMARIKAFPQKYSWFRKQAKRAAAKNMVG